jgi:hypothetical protein
MAFNAPRVDDLLRVASTSRSKSVVTLAAVLFAVCHVVAMLTGPWPAHGSVAADPDIPRQLIHFAAVLCRFALPLGVIILGIIQPRSKRFRLP